MPIELPLSSSGQTALEVARLCANEASSIITRNFGRHRPVEKKGRGNFLTETDLAVERAVMDLLSAEYPGHRILAEETSGGWAKAAEPPNDYGDWQWVVDPLDGTHNFSQGIPHFCFNLALCYGDEPVLALTYDPMLKEEFSAVQGLGLRIDGELASVSDVESLRDSVLGIGMAYDDLRAARLLDTVRSLWPGMQAVRIMGSAALGLANAASARYDLFVHNQLAPWDSAAGILLVREGGGSVVDAAGHPATIRSEGVVAGAPKVVADFLRLAGGRFWR